MCGPRLSGLTRALVRVFLCKTVADLDLAVRLYSVLEAVLRLYGPPAEHASQESMSDSDDDGGSDSDDDNARGSADAYSDELLCALSGLNAAGDVDEGLVSGSQVHVSIHGARDD